MHFAVLDKITSQMVFYDITSSFRIEFLNDNEPVFVVRDLPPGARYTVKITKRQIYV